MTMNLIKADLLKLRKDKPIKIIVVILLVMNLMSMGVFKVMDLLVGGEATEVMAAMGQFSFFSLFGLSNLGLLTAVACSMFVGKDFSYNTVRNKIIGGNSRLKIFLSAYAINAVIGLGLFAVTVAEGSLLGLAFFGVFENVGNCVKIVLLYVPLYLAFIAVMTFVSISANKQTMGIVLNVLIVVLIPSLLAFVQMANTTVLNSNGALTWLLSVCPYQIANTLAGADVSSMFAVPAASQTLALKTVFSSLILLLLALSAGCLVFRYRDVK